MGTFDRFEKIIGKDNLNKISKTKVLVVGIGGVGGYTVESLVRSGIEDIVIIDFDVVDITNINRQIIALNSTIGKKKVEVMKERLLDINKNCKVTIYDSFIDKINIDIITKEKPDFVVDACDTMTSKMLIIETCINNNIKFITSMGTGNKLDPSKLEITELNKTSYDPLAKVLRKWAKDNKIRSKIPVLYSNEHPIKISDRTPGSTSFVPSSAGLLITSYIIRKIIEIL